MLVEWESFKGYLVDERGFTESSANIYVYKSRFTAITKYFAECPFTKENIRLYIHHIKTTRNASVSTVNKHIVMLKHIASFIGKSEEMEGFKLKKEPVVPYDILSIEDQQKLLSTHPHRGQFDIISNKKKRREMSRLEDLKYDLALEIFLTTGIRFNELKGLTSDCYTGVSLKIYSSKTSTWRYVPVMPPLRKKLDSLPCPIEHLFSTMDNGALNNEIHKRILLSGIKVKGISCRRLRTTCGTTLLRYGAKIEDVSKILGHSKITMTYERYHKELIDDLIEAASVHPLSSTDPLTLANIWIDLLYKRLSRLPLATNVKHSKRGRTSLTVERTALLT